MIRFHAHHEAGENVGPIQCEGDMPESLRLALRTEAPSREIDTFEFGVVFRTNERVYFQDEAVGRSGNNKALRFLTISIGV